MKKAGSILGKDFVVVYEQEIKKIIIIIIRRRLWLRCCFLNRQHIQKITPHEKT